MFFGVGLMLYGSQHQTSLYLIVFCYIATNFSMTLSSYEKEPRTKIGIAKS
jgi:hypothetical protein